MQKHNILGKKAGERAALKEKIISILAWIFIIFCVCIIFYFCRIGLKNLFLTSNKHFTLSNVRVKAINLPDKLPGMVDRKKLIKHLQLRPGTDNIFEIDLKSLKKKVMENIVVESAEVSYQFPDTINIQIVEKRPVARLENNSIITPVKVKNGNAGYILPPADEKFFLPYIQIPKADLEKCKPGFQSDSKYLNQPLNLILLNETFRMKYDDEDNKAVKVLGKKEFASMEVLQINDVFLDINENTLNIKLKGNKKLFLSNMARLKILADDIEMGIRRACIAIIENASVRKQSTKIDARYSSTSTE